MAAAGESTHRVSIRLLKLTNFRSYSNFHREFSSGIVVITGNNGVGKTNLLEAISLLSPGRGLRRATLSSIESEGKSAGFSVYAELDGPEGEFSIGTGTAANTDSSEAGRKVRINGSTARSSTDLLDWLRIVWMTPAMDRLFTGPGSDRRRFLDRMVLAIDPGHGKRTIAYEKAMRNRNRLISENIRDESWFAAIEQEMAESGVAISVARDEFIRVLQAEIDQQDVDSLFPGASLSLSRTLESEAGSQSALDLETAFARRLADNRNHDRAAGRTLIGPHRSDLEVRHVPKDMPAGLCSTGEQKALLTGLVLAHARITTKISGLAPILLLDEIAAHLDPGRRAALFNILENMGCQVFMTGTERSPFSELEGRADFVLLANGGR